jgi:hypothetical protein
MTLDFPRGDAVEIFCLITGHDCLVAHLQRLLIYPSPMYILCSEEKSIMNKDHLNKCTVLNTGNNIVKIYWDARRQMKFLEVPAHWILLFIHQT